MMRTMFSGPVKKMNSFFQIELTLISRTFERVLVRSSSMTDSSIWLLEIWPKWILVIKKQKCQLGPILYAADDSKAPCVYIIFALPPLEISFLFPTKHKTPFPFTHPGRALT